MSNATTHAPVATSVRVENGRVSVCCDIKRNSGATLRPLLSALRRHLVANRERLFKKQHRSKKKFTFKGSFKVGVGSTQPGHLQHLEKPGFIKHPFKNTGVFVRPVAQQKRSEAERGAYELASRVLRAIDPDYARGEYTVQFALMESECRVDKHKDDDVSHQYAYSFGDFTGATLRVYDRGGRAYQDIDYKDRILKFEGRNFHEVLANGFEGQRFSVIWYKNYDARQIRPDPLLETPEIVWSES